MHTYVQYICIQPAFMSDVVLFFIFQVCTILAFIRLDINTFLHFQEVLIHRLTFKNYIYFDVFKCTEWVLHEDCWNCFFFVFVLVSDGLFWEFLVTETNQETRHYRFQICEGVKQQGVVMCGMLRRLPSIVCKWILTWDGFTVFSENCSCICICAGWDICIEVTYM